MNTLTRLVNKAISLSTGRCLPLLCIAAMGMLASCNNHHEKTVPASEVLHQRDSLLAIISDKDQELNDFMASFTEVQEGLRQISEAEGRVTIANGNIEAGDNREVVRENMEFMREALQSKREQIAQLKERLKASSLNVRKMQEALDNLQHEVEIRDVRIQELEVMLAERDQLIAQQSDTINELDAQNRHKDEIVAAQDKQLNEAYFVFGTKTELKNQKILDGKEVLTKGDFNKSYFTKIDIRVDKQIKLYSKSATIKTTHPQGSYKLDKDAKGEYILNITNPKEFWSTSRYLVVLVK